MSVLHPNPRRQVEARGRRVTTTTAAIVSGGVGAALGGIGAAIITSMGGKGESRAHAADLVANAAAGLVDRVIARDERIDKENAVLRHALSDILDVIDQIGQHDPVDELLVARLKRASHSAREAI